MKLVHINAIPWLIDFTNPETVAIDTGWLLWPVIAKYNNVGMERIGATSLITALINMLIMRSVLSVKSVLLCTGQKRCSVNLF